MDSQATLSFSLLRRCSLLAAAAASLALFGCPSSGDSPRGTGGASANSGGSTGSGGRSAVTGGTTGSGGGVNATGGAASGGSSSGGVTGSGGMPGSGGSAMATGGSPGSGGGAGGGGGPCRAAGLIFCDDFEARTVGVKPVGTPWLPSECFASNFTLKVDAGVAFSGTKALVSQGIPYGACMLHADLGTVQDFWVRTRVRFAKGSATQFSAHEVSAFELTPTANTDDPGIRVGFRGDSSCMPTGAEVNITGGEEKTGCTGFQLQADTWYCFELHVARDASNQTTADLSIDGANQAYHVHGVAAETVVNPNPAVWKYLRLGTRSYSNQYESLVYIDDIAVGTQPIGCN